MMLCPNCNNNVADGSKFCVHCGHQLNFSNNRNDSADIRKLGLSDPVIVEDLQQFKAAIKTNSAIIYLADDLTGYMKLFSSGFIAPLAIAVIFLVTLFNGLFIIAAVAFLLAVLDWIVSFIQYFSEGKINYKKYVFNGSPSIENVISVYYVHKKYVPYYEMRNVKTVRH